MKQMSSPNGWTMKRGGGIGLRKYITFWLTFQLKIGKKNIKSSKEGAVFSLASTPSRSVPSLPHFDLISADWWVVGFSCL
jgi:hypothetical protein